MTCVGHAIQSIARTTVVSIAEEFVIGHTDCGYSCGVSGRYQRHLRTLYYGPNNADARLELKRGPLASLGPDRLYLKSVVVLRVLKNKSCRLTSS